MYGTYDPHAGRSWQVKRPVTDQVIRDHLQGRSPFGVYLLDGERTGAVVVDFDKNDIELPHRFSLAAKTEGLAPYIERSKSKGYHVWLFFAGTSVLASKARHAVLGLLARLHMQGIEVFPKQDRLSDPSQFGNFINTPLFGRLVPQGRSVFLDERLQPYPDQWAFLAGIEQIEDSALGRVIALEPLNRPAPQPSTRVRIVSRVSSLVPCAERMLREGVTANQRVACFRLACQLRKSGVVVQQAVELLLGWAQRNRPLEGKGIIRPNEVASQVQSAFQARFYRSCGCEDPTVMPFCDPSCPVRRR